MQARAKKPSEFSDLLVAGDKSWRVHRVLPGPFSDRVAYAIASKVRVSKKDRPQGDYISLRFKKIV